MGWIVDIVDQDVVQQHADRSASSFPSQIINVNILIHAGKEVYVVRFGDDERNGCCSLV